MERTSIKYFVNDEADSGKNLFISSVGFEEIPSNSRYPTLNHSAEYYFNPEKGRLLKEYQLVYIIDGEGVLETRSGGLFSIKRGMMFVLFPSEWHTYYPNYKTGWNQYWIGFNGPDIESWMTGEYCSKENPVFKVGINEEIVSLFRKAIEVANEEQTLYQRVLGGLVNYLVGLMCSIDKNISVKNDDFSSKIEYACVLMRELIDQPVSMQEIAKKSGMGYSLFRKLFKERVHFAPAQYFQNLKIQKAIELLTTTTIPVKEVAYRLNFETPAYFSAQFKKQTGKSPTEYRDGIGIK